MEPLTRITYRDPTGQPRTDRTLRRESLVDHEKYLLPWGRAHGAALHSPGVSTGLEVRATQGAAGVRVQPGVALSANGDQIVLAPGGRAKFRGAPIPVADAGVQLTTAGLEGPHVLTISRSELADDRVLDGEERKVVDEAPELVLRPGTAAGSNDEVVLAGLTFTAGAVTTLGVGSRRQSGGELTLTRPAPTGSGSDLTVGSDVAARLSPAGTGLEITADGLTVRRRTGAAALAIDPATGNVGVGTANPQTALHVQGDALVAGALTVQGAFRLTGALTVSQIASSGPLAVAGGLTVTDGSLDANRGLRVTGDSSVQGTLAVGRLSSPTGSVTALGGLGTDGSLSVAGSASISGGVAASRVDATAVSAWDPEVGRTPVTGVSGTEGIEDPGGIGVHGIGVGPRSNGVKGEANTGDNAYGIWGVSAEGYAGQFDGKVRVTGQLEQNGGGFRIDHPLDPENRFLSHSFVESPHMLNVYCGIVDTDGDGLATVQLPDYFTALNEEFTYQLTVLGQVAGASVVEEITAGNAFTIRSEGPNARVSWHVTGIRKDPFAMQNRIVVEERKPRHVKGVKPEDR